MMTFLSDGFETRDPIPRGLFCTYCGKLAVNAVTAIPCGHSFCITCHRNFVASYDHLNVYPSQLSLQPSSGQHSFFGEFESDHNDDVYQLLGEINTSPKSKQDSPDKDEFEIKVVNEGDTYNDSGDERNVISSSLSSSSLHNGTLVQSSHALEWQLSVSVSSSHISVCPEDGRRIIRFVENSAVSKQVEKLPVFCCYCCKGRDELFTYRDYSNHISGCPERPVNCPNCLDCEQMPYKKLIHHLQLCKRARCPYSVRN